MAGEEPGPIDLNEPKMTLEEMLLDLRSCGWSVAVHNDYRLNGKFHTFWLFTHPSGAFVKGEGPTDARAVAIVRSAVCRGAFLQKSEKTE